MADMDDSNWDDLLSDNKDKEFDVQYQQWMDKSDGSKNQLLFEIGGKGWLDKFSRDYDAVLTENKATGGEAALYFGITGIVNFIAALLCQIFIVGKSTDTFISFAWGFATVYHQLAWVTVIVLWILTMVEDL